MTRCCSYREGAVCLFWCYGRHLALGFGCDSYGSATHRADVCGPVPGERGYSSCSRRDTGGRDPREDHVVARRYFAVAEGCSLRCPTIRILWRRGEWAGVGALGRSFAMVVVAGVEMERVETDWVGSN